MRVRRQVRPRKNCTNEFDRGLALNGDGPYPWLSVPDMNTVWRELEARKMSSREIAERLRVSRRTVHRWRSKSREEGEMK